MRIVCMGSGGLGGYFGGLLAASGADVAFVARGRHLAAMRAEGLTIERDGGRPGVHVPRPEATDDAASLGRADLVLVNVKLWDTAAAIAAIRPLVGPATCVLSLQNGVTKDDMLAEAFGRDRLLGGVAYVATTIVRPGVIAQTGPMQRLLFGGYAPAGGAVARVFLEAALRAGIDAAIPPDISVAIWQKFVFLTGLSSLAATVRTPIGPVRENALARAFLADIFAEVVAVGQALGVALPAEEAASAMTRADTVPPTMTASLAHDLAAGNRLEVPWLAGAVVELGATAGVATPCCRAVAAILAPHVMGRIA